MATGLWFSLRPGKILTWTGKILTPILLVILGILLFTALSLPAAALSLFAPTGTYLQTPVLQGLLDGYNTMDTLAGLAFGIFVVDAMLPAHGEEEPPHPAHLRHLVFHDDAARRM